MAEQSAKDEERASKKGASESSGKKKCPTCKKGTPLWFISWADMVTLLLCLFVIIVAYSTQEKGQYLTLAGSMRDAFGSRNPDASMPPIARGYHLVNMQFQTKITLVHIAEQIQALLTKLIEAGQAKVSSDDMGVTVQIDKDLLFQPGTTLLTDFAQQTLVGIAGVITLLPNTVEISAPRVATTGQPFAWETGMAEAAVIASLFEQQGGILYQRIQVTSLVETAQGTAARAAQKEKIEIKIMKTTNPEE
jgi:chemotaxis protein MotB